MKIYPIKYIGLDLLSCEAIRKPKAIALEACTFKAELLP